MFVLLFAGMYMYVHVVWLNVAYTPTGSENNAVYVYAKQVSSPMLTYQYNAPRGLLVRHHNIHVCIVWHEILAGVLDLLVGFGEL